MRDSRKLDGRQFLIAVAKHRLQRAVATKRASRRINQNHPDRGILENETELRFPSSQGFLRAFLLGKVGESHNYLINAAVRAKKRARTRQNPHPIVESRAMNLQCNIA